MKSLRAQLTVRLLCGGVLLLIVAGAALEWQMHRALTAQFDAVLRATATSLTVFTEHKASGIKVEREGATLPPFDQLDSHEVFLLRTADGREIQRSFSLGDAPLPLRAGPPETPEFFDAKLPDGRKLRCVGLRFLPKMVKKAREQNASGVEAILTVGRERAPLDSTFTTLRAALLLIGTGALAALAVLVRVGVRGGLAPLDRLGEAVATVNANSLGTRFAPEGLPSELRPIAMRFNELLARLGAAFARERRFTSAAAHELRTPITELRALAEVNLTTPATDEESAESWREALTATRRMETLALRLLDLARCEDSKRVVQSEPVPLAEAVAEGWRPWAAYAAARGVTIELAVSPGLTARTDAALLAIIVGNLCSNAAQYAPAGAMFRVGARREADDVTLFFRNRAGTLTAADLPHLFERFWRKDGARADGHHHGLGLALAAEFAVLLGGGLAARMEGDGDVEFALRLRFAGDSLGFVQAGLA